MSGLETVSGAKRLDIQALRALAVASVLGFHFDLKGFAGGYLGVDIFFVVSGFLITRILDRELLAGEITLSQFYMRRVRRLLPALVVTIAATLAVATIVFVSIDLAPAAKSAAAALLSSSNILFWLESGYFDASSDLKPLLHTWSLGVEEQFYLVWPGIVLVSARYGRRVLIVALAMVGLVSLAVAQVLLPKAPDAVFYLMPFRAFEFAIGALLSFVPQLRPSRLTTVLFVGGWAMMLLSVTQLDADYAMTTLVLLLPTGGAGLAILAGAAAPRWLLARPVIAVGDLSYSLYLVHWPLVVFLKYKFGSELDLLTQVSLLAGSFVLAWMLCRFVEVPMRTAEFWRSAFPVARQLGAVTFILGTFFVAAGVWASDGKLFHEKHRRHEKPLAISRSALENMRDTFLMERLWSRGFKEHGRRILIIGDSHAQDVFSALYQSGSTNLFYLPVRYPCQPVLGPRAIEAMPPRLNMPDASKAYITSAAEAQKCTESVNAIVDSRQILKADTIVIAARWKNWAVPRVADIIAAIRQRTEAPIIVFGPSVEFSREVSRIVLEHGSLSGADQAAEEYEVRGIRSVDADLKKHVLATGAIFVDKFSILCSGDERCPVVVPGTQNLFIFDYGHWTVEGAAYFGQSLRRASPLLHQLLFG